MKCPKCNIDNIDGANFCASCGSQLPIKSEQTKIFCPKCGAENQTDSKFCCSCGCELHTQQDSKHANYDDFCENKQRTGKILIAAGVLLMFLGLLVNQPSLNDLGRDNIFAIMIFLISSCGVYPLLKYFFRKTKNRFFISAGLFVVSVFVATAQGDRGLAISLFFLSGFLLINAIYSWYRIEYENQ